MIIILVIRLIIYTLIKQLCRDQLIADDVLALGAASICRRTCSLSPRFF